MLTAINKRITCQFHRYSNCVVCGMTRHSTSNRCTSPAASSSPLRYCYSARLCSSCVTSLRHFVTFHLLHQSCSTSTRLPPADRFQPSSSRSSGVLHTVQQPLLGFNIKTADNSVAAVFSSLFGECFKYKNVSTSKSANCYISAFCTLVVNELNWPARLRPALLIILIKITQYSIRGLEKSLSDIPVTYTSMTVYGSK